MYIDHQFPGVQGQNSTNGWQLEHVCGKDKSEDRSPELADSVHKAPSKVKSRHSGSKGPRPKATSRISEGVEVGVIYHNDTYPKIKL